MKTPWTQAKNAVSRSVLIPVSLWLQAVSGLAGNSFLDQFSGVPHSETQQTSSGRPEFMSPSIRQTDFDSDSIRHQGTNEPTDLFPGATWNLEDDRHKVYSASDHFDQDCAEQDSKLVPSNEVPLVRFRNGCYQGSQLNYGYIHDDLNSGIAIQSLDTYSTFAVPLGSMDNVISLIPYFRAEILNSAPSLDVPATLYDTGLKMFWKRPLGERFSTSLLFTPSVRSDFTTSDNAFRLFGMGLLTWQAFPQKLALTGGAMYTGRVDYPVLPAMGLLWTPTSRWRLDVQFPAPRLSYCLRREPDSSETWGYFSGVFGGNTWAVTRKSGSTDQLTLGDLRLVLGIEHLLVQNRGLFAETGLVWNRSMEYTRVPYQRDFDSTWMVRAGVSF